MTQATFAFTPAFVAQALGVAPPSGGPARYSAIVTDSRKIQKDCLFVALPGEKFDGHDFIPQALAQGAAAVLCRTDYAGLPQGAAAFRVKDSLDGYRRLAAAWRARFSFPVITVAGSVGKTTTKEILTAILRGRWPEVLKTQGSQNGFVGIPMTLLELRPAHGAAVIEVGIDEPGAMKQHMDLFRSDAAVLTAIGPEHLEKLIDMPTVAREEAIALQTVAARGGFVAINLDDPWIAPLARELSGARRLTYSLSDPAADLRGRLSDDGASLELSGAGLDGERFALPLPGTHNARNLLAALAVARGLGLSAEDMRRGLETFQGAEGRSELRSLMFASGASVPVVADYYNAQPVSMEAGLELLAQVARGAKAPRLACLGDMLEMGAEELRIHRELAPSILRLGIETVLLYGPRMKALEDELRQRGFAGKLAHFETHAALAEEALRCVREGTARGAAPAILIKGSRGMRMEEVWKILSTARS